MINILDSLNRDFIEKSVLLGLRLDSIGKKRKVSESMLEELEAGKGMIHVHKDILNCPELNAIALLDGQIRGFIRKNTYPTDFGNGVYILPLAILEEVDERLVQLKVDRDILIQNFCDNYDKRKEEARERLGKFYTENDYPPVDTLTSRFDFKVQCLSFDVPKNLATLNPKIYEREKSKAEESWSKTFGLIKDTLRKDLTELIEHLAERLTLDNDGKKKRFKDATVGNLLEFLNSFEKKNIVSDEHLSNVVSRLSSTLEGISIEKLREDDEVREMVLFKLDEVLYDLSDMREAIHMRTISFE